jgi:hypothetical protein
MRIATTAKPIVAPMMIPSGISLYIMSNIAFRLIVVTAGQRATATGFKLQDACGL